MASSSHAPKRRIEIPQAMFDALSVLFPKMIDAMRRCDLDAVDFFTLWYMKHLGSRFESRIYLRREELTTVLKKEFHYTDKHVFTKIDQLANEGFIERRMLNQAEAEVIFHVSGGRKQVVILTE